MDSNGKIGGLLDIAKCLYDAVTRLEKAAKKKAAEETGEDDSTVMIGAVMEAAKAMKGKASAKNQRALQVPFRCLFSAVSVVALLVVFGCVGSSQPADAWVCLIVVS